MKKIDNANAIIEEIEINKQITKDEIKALAELSNTCDANMYEIIKGDNKKKRYSLCIKYKDNSTDIIISNDNIDVYTSEVKSFYEQFVEYSGTIVIDKLFLEKEEKDKKALISKALKDYVDNKNEIIYN